MRNIDRRGFVVSLAGAGLSAAGPAKAQNPTTSATSSAPPRFGFVDVVRRARDLATAPLAASPPLPESIVRLDPEIARDIRFRPDRAFLAGAGSRFRLQTIHLDPRSARPVTVNIIRDGIATPIPYAGNLFDYGRAKFERPLPLNLGFAGFRLQFPLNEPKAFSDAIVFTGSSEFRFLGRGQRPGASLRALCVNAGLDSEEFPFFREFWIETPEANAARATIYGLLDGDSVTGAFQFKIAPGVESRLDVAASLFPRRVGGVLGLAAVSSMYLQGESDRRAGGDYRPEVHNSDGLAMHTGADEWLWRQLRNPVKGARFAFLDTNPRGYGLMQRDRAFDHYQDLDAGFETRPNYWIEPAGDWGDGHVELVERPATDADASNILAAWVSNAPREPGKPVNLAYRAIASLEHRSTVTLGRVANTFQSPLSGSVENAPATTGGARRFLIDFSGGDLAYYLGGPAAIEVVASANNGQVSNIGLTPNPHVKGFRASIDVSAAPGQTADLRVSLRARGRVLTETWTLPWTG